MFLHIVDAYWNAFTLNLSGYSLFIYLFVKYVLSTYHMEIYLPPSRSLSGYRYMPGECGSMKEKYLNAIWVKWWYKGQ